MTGGGDDAGVEIEAVLACLTPSERTSAWTCTLRLSAVPHATH